MNGHNLPSPVKDSNPEEGKEMNTSKIIVHGFAWKRIGIFLKLGLPGKKPTSWMMGGSANHTQI